MKVGDACAAIAMQRGAFAKLATEDEDDHAQRASPDATKSRFTAEREGFNLNAGVHIAGGDELGRERLLRYGTRPPVWLSIGSGVCRARARAVAAADKNWRDETLG